jgi:hypothetical protein
LEEVRHFVGLKGSVGGLWVRGLLGEGQIDCCVCGAADPVEGYEEFDRFVVGYFRVEFIPAYKLRLKLYNLPEYDRTLIRETFECK